MGLALEMLQKWFRTVDADFLAEDLVWKFHQSIPVCASS
jgi:hypothetical protein